MIKVPQLDYIRHLYFKENISIRKIAKMVEMSRNTISKIVNAEDVIELSKYHCTKGKPSPVIDPVAELIDAWLEADKKVKPKQRHTAHRIWYRLVNEYDFTGGESTVRRYVRMKKQQPKDMFLLLEFAPGEAAQVDWGEADVIMDGIQTRVMLFCYYLAYSGISFVMAFPNSRQEALFEGHIEAFQHLGGLPDRIIYDNMKTAVKTLLTGKERIEQEAFIHFRNHHIFDADFCNPASGWEKGLVENLVGTSRRNFLVPLPEVKDYAELNALLWQSCQKAAQSHRVKDDKTAWDRWQEEKLQLRSLPSQPFDCCQKRRVVINSYSLVEFETNQYSVPVHYGSKEAIVKAYVHRIEIYSSKTQQLLAVHNRSYGRGQEILILDHYLELLAKKPGGLVNAKVVRHMPPLWKELLEQMKSKLLRGDKEFIKTLLLLRSYSEEIKEQTLLQALKRGLFVAEDIHDLARKIENQVRGLVEVVNLPMNACSDSVLAPDMTVYDQLISEVIHLAG
jgi:transposase